MIEYALLGPIQAVLAVQVFDLQVFALRHVRVVETISAVSAGMHTGFVQVYVHSGMTESRVTTVAEDDTFSSTVLRWTLGDEIHRDVRVHLLF